VRGQAWKWQATEQAWKYVVSFSYKQAWNGKKCISVKITIIIYKTAIAARIVPACLAG
jgi:hypothetical protein